MTKNRRALLGRIAEFGWFIQHGEAAATQSLAMLLEDSRLREALLRWLAGVTGTNLNTVELVVAEFVHKDGRRPDLEGHDEGSRPVLVVEAKFGAKLDQAQIRSYLSDQVARLAAGQRAAFVLLVPCVRVLEAERQLQAAVGEVQGNGCSLDFVGTAVVTWDDCIRALEDAAGCLPDASELAGDLVQFRAMCTALAGLIISPLGVAAFGRPRFDSS